MKYLFDIRPVNKILFILFSILFVFGLSSTVLAQEEQADPPVADIQNSTCYGANLQFTDKPSSNECEFAGVDATDQLNDIIGTVINTFSVIVGIVAVVMIIYGGFRYITSGGDSGNVTSARNTILYAIIGLIVVAFAQFIVKFVLSRAVNVAG